MQKFIIEGCTLTREPSGTRVSITGQDAKHIGKVLRLRPGDSLSMTDGKGMDLTGIIENISHGSVDVRVVTEEASRYESCLNLTVCTAMLKDKKMDMVIRELTQLGVTTWVPFFSERSVPTPDAGKLEKRVERWRSIARESLKQCRRSREVAILSPLSFKETLALGREVEHRIAFFEGSDRPLVLARDENSEEKGNRALVLIGPEGGFTGDEVDQALSLGFGSYSLGSRILRAETAAVAATALVQYLLGDLGK